MLVFIPKAYRKAAKLMLRKKSDIESTYIQDVILDINWTKNQYTDTTDCYGPVAKSK